MNVLDTLIQRNEAFAGSEFSPDLKILPSMATMIIGCVDPRVDPVDIFKLRAGEAAVIRNIGGRIDKKIFQTMAVLRSVSKAAGKDVGAGWNLIVLHHTDCGIKTCLQHAPDALAKYLDVATAELASLAIDDPYASVAIDVAALKANQQLPAAITVTGLVYDVVTGLVETVIPSSPLRPELAT